jgi:hypothetical protein
MEKLIGIIPVLVRSNSSPNKMQKKRIRNKQRCTCAQLDLEESSHGTTLLIKSVERHHVQGHARSLERTDPAVASGRGAGSSTGGCGHLDTSNDMLQI